MEGEKWRMEGGGWRVEGGGLGGVSVQRYEATVGSKFSSSVPLLLLLLLPEVDYYRQSTYLLLLHTKAISVRGRIDD